MYKKLKYLRYYSKVIFSNWTTKKESYSQHGEDILVENLLENGVKSFIDIGANDGVLFSNTYKFAKQGANGICIEPSKAAFNKLRFNQLLNPKVFCINAALSNKSGFLYVEENGYESTLSTVCAAETPKSIKVKTYTFDKLLEMYPKFVSVDLLSIDVEGHENEVLQGLTSRNFYAKIIILETDKHSIDELMNNSALQKYEPKYTNGINTIFTNVNVNLKIVQNLPKGFWLC